MAEPPRYRVTVVATGDGPPAIIRLRHLLKAMLRAWGLRCVKVEELTDPPPKEGPGDG